VHYTSARATARPKNFCGKLAVGAKFSYNFAISFLGKFCLFKNAIKIRQL